MIAQFLPAAGFQPQHPMVLRCVYGAGRHRPPPSLPPSPAPAPGAAASAASATAPAHYCPPSPSHPHPLHPPLPPLGPQVVELPRQKPGPALRLFARVAAHARILVVGGDGSGAPRPILFLLPPCGAFPSSPGHGCLLYSCSAPPRFARSAAWPAVAWVLSCLEELKEQRAAAGDAHWVPPPVGVLPLGTGVWGAGKHGVATRERHMHSSFTVTLPAPQLKAAGSSGSSPPLPPSPAPLDTPGNDLARCLGWGGGHGAWAQEGVGAMLAEVQHGAPVHIDRWAARRSQRDMRGMTFAGHVLQGSQPAPSGLSSS